MKCGLRLRSPRLQKVLDKKAVDDQFGLPAPKSAIDPNGAPLMKQEYKASTDVPADKVASPNYERTETGVTDILIRHQQLC